MKKQIIRYAVIRFQPYPETGEFANIGIIAINHQRKEFQYRLAEKHSKRVTNFFKNIDRAFYTTAVQQLKLELEARANAARYGSLNTEELFNDLIKPKSNLFQFEQPGAMKGENLGSAADNLYEDFVEHRFAKKRSYEEQLRLNVKSQLEALELTRPFMPRDILGNFGLKAHFELVRENKTIESIIKPFGYEGNDVNKLHFHLTNEIRKLEIAHVGGMLKKKDILIPYKISSESGSVLDAWDTEFKTKLETFGDLVEAENSDRITQFATH